MVLSQPVEHDVEAAVRDRRGANDLSHAPHRIDIRIPMIVFAPVSSQQSHADQLWPGNSVLHHLAVTRLKDMKRKMNFRKKHYVGQRKNRNDLSLGMAISFFVHGARFDRDKT